MFHDAPYGLNLADWDKPMTREDLALTISQIFPQNKSQHHVYVGMCHFSQKAMFAEVLKEKGYTDVHEAFWQKLGINVPGHQRYTFSVEHMIVGYYGGRRNNVWQVPADPMQRLNTIFGPVLKHSTLNESGKPVNPCEKPPYLARIFAKHHVQPGNHVLVFGAGSGSDVLGALAAGCNVTALESDVNQFPYLVQRLQKVATDMSSAEGQKERSWVEVMPSAMAGTTGVPTKYFEYFNTPWKFESPAAIEASLLPRLPKVQSEASVSTESTIVGVPPPPRVVQLGSDVCNECGEKITGSSSTCKVCKNISCESCAGGQADYTCGAHNDDK